MKKKFFEKSDLVFAEIPTTKRSLDLTGRRFGWLTVLGFAGMGNYKWYCECDCGNIISTQSFLLLNGGSKSCGCFQRKRASETFKTHGHTANRVFSKSYRTWGGMIQRCTNSNHRAYSYYGGRGIKVCDRWMNFENFYEDVGDRPHRMTIERIDNNGDYEPNNCRWATQKEQCNNKKSNVLLTYNGITKNATQWAEYLGFDQDVIFGRIRQGWSIDRIITTPLARNSKQLKKSLSNDAIHKRAAAKG